MDANPAHRPAAGGAFANRRELLAVPLHGRMAVHAGLRGRNVRDRRKLDRGMTVPTIETQLADVKFVAIWNRLNGTIANVRVPRRKVVPDARYCERRTEDAHDGRHDRELVQPRGEDLSHLGLWNYPQSWKTVKGPTRPGLSGFGDLGQGILGRVADRLHPKRRVGNLSL